MMFDCVFTRGSVIDGSGAKAIAADVGVKTGAIEAVGDLSRAETKQRVDCAGYTVCPGFIDPHTHVDFQILLFPMMGNLIQQGITSTISGNCSLSALPSSKACRMHLGALGALSQLEDVPYEWTTLDGYYAALEDAGIAINVGQLVGHGPLRTQVMGFTNDLVATPDNLRTMGRILEGQLDEGAFGFSSGRSYVPSRFADLNEMVELSRVCHAKGGIHAQHVKQLSSWEGIDEFLATSDRSSCRMQMAHFCPQSQADLDKGFAMFEEAKRRGTDVTFTSITYPFYSLRSDSLARGLGATLGMHPKLEPGGDVTLEGAYERFRRALDSPELVAEFKQILVNTGRQCFIDYFDMTWAAEQTSVLDAGFGAPPANTVGEISRLLGKNRVDTAWDLIFGDGPLYIFSATCLPDEFIAPLCAHPQGVPMTDATYRWTNLYDRGADPWPVSFGAFPRYFRLMREIGVPLEEAVYKVTGFSAETFNIKDRGYLRKGQAADITVFDGENLRERATLTAPFEESTGVRHVMVNGKFVMFDCDLTGVRAGKGLRRG